MGAFCTVLATAMLLLGFLLGLSLAALSETIVGVYESVIRWNLRRKEAIGRFGHKWD